jgi:large subunit ribosomal protein L29
MKVVDVRAKTDDELKEQLTQLAREQYNMRFQKASGQLANTAHARVVRRDIARIQSVLGERSRGVKIVAKTPKSSKKAK